MSDEITYQLALALVSPGTWSLAADGVLLAGLTGHDDAEEALSWASHTLRTTHGVVVGSWTPDAADDGRSMFRAVVTSSDAIGGSRELFRFVRGKPLPTKD